MQLTSVNMEILFAFCCLIAASKAGIHGYHGYPSLGNHINADLYSGGGHAYGLGYDYSHAEIGPHGVPHDTEEVAAAKAVHFAEHAKAHARLYGGHKDEGPVDTPEVQIEKFKHNLAHNEAKLRLANPHLAHSAGPAETPEVQIAKHEHAEAHAEAELRAHNPAVAHAHAAAAGPVDTFEVQKAKVEHFHAHAKAKAQHALGHHDVPQDTPEVELAKFQHLTALAQAQVQHQYGGQHDHSDDSGHEQVISYESAGYDHGGYDYHHY